MEFRKNGLRKATKKEEEEFRENMQKMDVGGKDVFAMILSAFLVIVIPCALFLTGLCFFVMWIMGLL